MVIIQYLNIGKFFDEQRFLDCSQFLNIIGFNISIGGNFLNVKKFFAFFIAVTMSFSLFGCSSKSDDAYGAELIEKARNNLEQASNYDAEIKLNFEFVNNSGTETAFVDTKISDFREPYMKHIAIASEGGGENIGYSEFYIIEENGRKTLYMYFNEKWYKTTVDDEYIFYTLGQYDMKEIVNIFLSAASEISSVDEEERNGVKLKKVNAVIDKSIIAETIINTGVFIAAGMSSLTPEYLEGAGPMKISFWIDDNDNVVKISFDAAEAYQTISDNLYDMVKDLEGYEGTKKLVINKYAIDIDMININNAEWSGISEDALKAEEISAPETGDISN